MQHYRIGINLMASYKISYDKCHLMASVTLNDDACKCSLSVLHASKTLLAGLGSSTPANTCGQVQVPVLKKNSSTSTEDLPST